MVVLLFSLITVQVFAQGAGNALQFDGMNDYVDITHNDNLNMTMALTLDVWIKPAGPGISNGIIVMKNPLKYSLIWLPESQRLTFSLDIGGWGDHLSNSVVPANQWSHVAGTYDGSNIRIYINGVLDAEYSYTGSIATSTDNLTFGCRTDGSGEFYNGLVDEMRIWNVARTQQQIREDMHRIISAQSGLVGYWKFDEGSNMTAADSSGNGNDGTLTNDPSWVASAVPLGSDGAFVNTTSQTTIGPSGGQLKTTITSTPDNSNNLGVYQFGSVSGEPVTNETFPNNYNKRSDLVWGIVERGSVLADLVFDYSGVSGINIPSTIRILYRAGPDSTIWTELPITSRDDVARTVNVNDVALFGEFTIGAGADNSLETPISTVPEIVKDFHLGNIYPNPFNAAFTIPLTLGKSSPVKLMLCDLNGKVVKVIENGIKPAGEYRIAVDCRDLTSGIYFLRLNNQLSIQVRKIILLR